ncbi:MAG: STAS domain-containing protein [Acidimicrobiales bacterium]|nr:STAS domain-containing protein [Acidimicrobiales bacterium]
MAVIMRQSNPTDVEPLAFIDRRARVAVALPARFDVHHLDAVPQPAPHDVVIDASAVEFADEAALASLVELRIWSLRLGGELRLVNPSTAFLAIVELTGDRDLLLTGPMTTDERMVA